MFEITRATPMGRHDRRRGEENFYDLDADAHELDDLSARPEYRSDMDRMRSQALDWWSQNGGDELDLP